MLCDLIWAQDPSVVFLAKTWIEKARLEGISVKYDLGSMINFSKERFFLGGGGVRSCVMEKRSLFLGGYILS